VPGFIDAHSHGDLILGSEDARLFKTTQGVTTEITGQCGLSMTPIAPENLTAIQNMCDEVIGNNNDFSVIKYVEDYYKKIK